MVSDRGSCGPVHWSNNVPGCSRCGFLGHWDSLWKHQCIWRIGEGKVDAGGDLRGQRGLYSGDTGQAVRRLGSQGHIGRSSASSDRPSIRKKSRDPEPTRDRAISLTSQGLRARLPPERPSAASSRSLPSLARWFALSLSCSLSRSGTSPRPPLARRPRLLLTRPSPAPGAARPEPRRAARPPGAAALILLPRSLCLDPIA